jgi:multiple sugar transport system permease protein
MNTSADIIRKSRNHVYYTRFFFTKIFSRMVLIAMCVFLLSPFYWMIISAIKSNEEMRLAPPTMFPRSFHWENFYLATQYIPFFRYMFNSLILALISMAGAVFSNSLVSYGLSRIPWKGRNILFYLIVSTMFIPFPITMIALFDIFARFHLINTYVPLTLPSFMGAATWIFMMRQYLLGIPKEISDAGYIDGANEFQIFSRLILPVMKPVIGVIAIFAAIGSWNDFLTPLIYLHDHSIYPLSIGIQLFRSEHTVEYSMLMAASALVVLPVVIIFLIFQRFFVEGITLGAVKG